MANGNNSNSGKSVWIFIGIVVVLVIAGILGWKLSSSKKVAVEEGSQPNAVVDSTPLADLEKIADSVPAVQEDKPIEKSVVPEKKRKHEKHRASSEKNTLTHAKKERTETIKSDVPIKPSAKTAVNSPDAEKKSDIAKPPIPKEPPTASTIQFQKSETPQNRPQLDSIAKFQASDSVQDRKRIINRIVAKESRVFKGVYDVWVKRDPALSGTMRVKIAVNPDGTVLNASVEQSNLNNSEFEDAILQYIRRWHFPPIEQKITVQEIFPFVFNP